jgi:predicted DNA-binding protein
MRTTKLVSFTLKLETIERLEKLVIKKSINKSAFVDRLINEEINKEEKINGKEH